jgi:hypothetical protein
MLWKIADKTYEREKYLELLQYCKSFFCLAQVSEHIWKQW